MENEQPPKPSSNKLELAKKVFEQVQRSIERPDYRSGDPRTLEERRRKMERIYPEGHEVPKKVK